VVAVTRETQLTAEQVEPARVRVVIPTAPPNPNAVASNAPLLESKGMLDRETLDEG
jgi:hypothetical protein